MWRKLLVSKISRNVVQNRPSETQQVALITLSMDSINRNRWKKKHKMTITAEKNGETAQAWLSAWSNQPQQEWRFLSGGKVAMCFKSFLHVCDKGCHHWLCFPNLVWPNTRTFHPSHVSTLTLDPNWPLLRQERLVYPAEVFKFCLWNLTVPRGFLLPGWGIENWQTQTTRVPVLALWRAHQTGSPVFLPPVGPNPIPDRSRDELTPLQKNSHSSLSANWESRNGVCVHT